MTLSSWTMSTPRWPSCASAHCSRSRAPCPIWRSTFTCCTGNSLVTVAPPRRPHRRRARPLTRRLRTQQRHNGARCGRIPVSCCRVLVLIFTKKKKNTDNTSLERGGGGGGTGGRTSQEAIQVEQTPEQVCASTQYGHCQDSRQGKDSSKGKDSKHGQADLQRSEDPRQGEGATQRHPIRLPSKVHIHNSLLGAESKQAAASTGHPDASS
mmetsp:Transcript_12643/g.32192  ORF Transcript_12643/g.32192 Transcript_12643/m.32192 type:complete len:210 (-) Transcript_12643:182-811(-)